MLNAPKKWPNGTELRFGDKLGLYDEDEEVPQVPITKGSRALCPDGVIRALSQVSEGSSPDGNERFANVIVKGKSVSGTIVDEADTLSFYPNGQGKNAWLLQPPYPVRPRRSYR